MKAACILFIFFLALSQLFCATARENTAKQEIYSEKSRSKSYKKDGWNIPGLDKGRIMSLKPLKREISGKKIVFKNYEPIAGAIENFEIAPQLLGLPDTKDWFVRQVSSYEVDGKIFLYAVEISRIGVNYETGVLFLDDDGDGIFETAIQRDSQINLPLIPRWLENESAG